MEDQQKVIPMLKVGDILKVDDIDDSYCASRSSFAIYDVSSPKNISERRERSRCDERMNLTISEKTGYEDSVDIYQVLIQKTIIEKYEIDLYHIIEKYHDTACGQIRLNDLLISHLIYINERNCLNTIEEDQENEYKNDLANIACKDSHLFIKYKIIFDLIDLFSALLIK